MNTTIALLAWVMVNGFPVASFDTCAKAETRAAELRLKTPDLQVLADCRLVQNADPEQAVEIRAPWTQLPKPEAAGNDEAAG